MIEGEQKNELHLLESDSPTLYQQIGRAYGKDSPKFHFLLKAYRLACDAGAKTECGFKRKEGVSYNPRPARCATLALKYTGENAAELIAATMLGCADREQVAKIARQSPEMQRALDMANHADEQMVSLHAGDCASEIDLEALCVALSISLDKIRHLHQDMESSIETKKAFLKRCESLLSRARQHPQTESFSSLLSIYSQAITRQTARL